MSQAGEGGPPAPHSPSMQRPFADGEMVSNPEHDAIQRLASDAETDEAGRHRTFSSPLIAGNLDELYNGEEASNSLGSTHQNEQSPM